MKWVIGLPVVTAGLIAIDKHASGALPRNPSSASADISDVGLFATAGAVGVLLIGDRYREHALAERHRLLSVVENDTEFEILAAGRRQLSKPLEIAGSDGGGRVDLNTPKFVGCEVDF